MQKRSMILGTIDNEISPVYNGVVKVHELSGRLIRKLGFKLSVFNVASR